MSISFPEYELYDGLGLAELISNGDFSATEMLEIAIDRIELLNPFVNAISQKMYDEARVQITQLNQNTGRFSGVPFLLKDLGPSYANFPTTFGSAWLKDFTRPYHSELVQRYLKAGLIIIGKTTTPELGLKPVTESALNGITGNPWDSNYTAGGSSGGSAAAVASRMVPLAHASDGAGSIRIPASCCGLFGLKPTRGRVPSGPDFGRLLQGLCTEHVLTRSVRDSAAILDASLGDDLGTPLPLQEAPPLYLESLEANPGSLSIGIIEDPFVKATIHADCSEALKSSANLCTELGHTVEETQIDLNADELIEAFAIFMCAETANGLRYFQNLTNKAPKNEIEFTSKIIARLGKIYRADELSWALSVFDQISRKMGPLFEKYDVILTPTLAMPPVKNSALEPNRCEKWFLQTASFLDSSILMKTALLQGIRKNFAFSPYTVPFNITGQPTMSVPLFWNRQGLPIGSQFVGRFGDEMTLFQLARQLEKARPWQHRVPNTRK
jgi:amidase